VAVVTVAAVVAVAVAVAVGVVQVAGIPAGAVAHVTVVAVAAARAVRPRCVTLCARGPGDRPLRMRGDVALRRGPCTRRLRGRFLGRDLFVFSRDCALVKTILGIQHLCCYAPTSYFVISLAHYMVFPHPPCFFYSTCNIGNGNIDIVQSLC